MARCPDEIVVESGRPLRVIAIPDHDIMLRDEGGEIRHFLRKSVSKRHLQTLTSVDAQYERLELVVIRHFDGASRIGHTAIAIAAQSAILRLGDILPKILCRDINQRSRIVQWALLAIAQTNALGVIDQGTALWIRQRTDMHSGCIIRRNDRDIARRLGDIVYCNSSDIIGNDLRVCWTHAIELVPIGNRNRIVSVIVRQKRKISLCLVIRTKHTPSSCPEPFLRRVPSV